MSGERRADAKGRRKRKSVKKRREEGYGERESISADFCLDFLFVAAR
jgi:hypothetical protein